MANVQRYDYVLPKGFVLKGGVNEYVIEEVLGKGGFGITYKVKASVLYMNINIEAYFAVKEFFPDICSRESDNVTIKIPETKHQEIVDGKQDFINEGLKLQEVCKLNPNIVNVNEVFEANGTAYYVLEYLDGGDLRKMVRGYGRPLTEQQMLGVMMPIGHALQCLHDNRMLHLDVKPDNIVMRRKNDGTVEPVLIDFGIAVHFNNDGSPTSKTPSQGISPGYSPIEQYSQVKRFDPRIDVYAYCATCLYLLCGRDPIEATEMPEGFVRNELPAGTSANIVEAIERGMSLNKNTRLGSIDEVLSLVTRKGVVQDKPQPLPVNDVPISETRQIPNLVDTPQKLEYPIEPESSKSRKKLLIVLASVLAVALIAGIVMLSKRCGSGSSIVESVSGDENIIGDYEVETIKVNDSVSIKMVKVPGGTFTMGSTQEQDTFPDQKPAHSVTLSTYYIGQTEVTQELWETVMGSNRSLDSLYAIKGAKRPVEQVSWDDCQKFIRKLNNMTGKNFRLPTEAEWEYAARGGSKSQHFKYSGSNNIDDVAWYHDNSGDETHDVATKQPNELGIYDMTGNVLEWCSDWYGEYSLSSQNNPQGPASGSWRVYRGGCLWTPSEYCRVSSRNCMPPDIQGYGRGLRLAL